MVSDTSSLVKLINSTEDVESNQNTSQAEEESKTSWIACVASSLAFILCSGSLVFILKALTSIKEFYFPFFITTVRVLFTLLALEILRNLKLINLSVLTLEESQSFLWPTICYIIQVTTSLGAMKGMSIPLYTSIKRCGPLINMVLSIILLKKKKPSWLSQVSVILAAIGCVISGTGELTVNYRGYVNATVSLLSKSFYFTLVEAQDYGVLKFIQLLCYNSLPILLFMSWFTDELNQAFSFIQSSDLQFLTLFVLTVVIGSCLVYVEFLCITLTSALTVSILGTIRSLCQIILGFFLVEGAPSNTLFLLGIGLNFFGGLLYLTEKLLLKSKYRYQYACFRNFFVRHDL